MPPSQLRDYQHRGLDALGELYADGHSRATLVLPCGTGKTIVAAHLIGELAARRVVVFVPTVQLLEQTLRRLAGDNPDARLLAVCSPTALDEDDLPETAAAATIDQPVTTDPDAIADTITRTSGPLIVAATYASSPKIAEATTAAGIRWGLLVCDEAHRTAGTADKAWALPLHDDAIPAHRRLAMTATTRIIDVDDDRLPTDLDADDVQIVSMDSLADYGPHVEPLTFRSAIGDNHLSDYQIAVVSVPHRRALALLSHDQQHQPSKRDLQSAAAQLALTH
ncbi:MAG: DEAD/DEAH box helicase family protein, partial [Tomitella sp.]|nr:DEAD/DEAH box helicase family protein [Tomitella sp.]